MQSALNLASFHDAHPLCISPRLFLIAAMVRRLPFALATETNIIIGLALFAFFAVQGMGKAVRDSVPFLKGRFRA